MSDDLKNLYKQFGEYPYVSDTPKTATTTDTSSFLQRRKMLGGSKSILSDIPKADTSSFLQRRKILGSAKNLPGPIGKAVSAGALAGVALEKGINKLKSMEGREAESEIPSDVENKAKGGMTKGQKKIGKVMREFKKGELHSGKKGPVVKNPKQAIAIALSEAGMSKPQKKQDGGLVRYKKQYQMHNGKF